MSRDSTLSSSSKRISSSHCHTESSSRRTHTTPSVQAPTTKRVDATSVISCYLSRVEVACLNSIYFTFLGLGSV